MAAGRDHWVVCDEYTAGPYTAGHAERKLKEITQIAAAGERHACYLEHSIVVADAAPVPPWKRRLEGGH